MDPLLGDQPTPVKTVGQPTDNSESSAEHTQKQPVTPVSFASTTQGGHCSPSTCRSRSTPGPTCAGTSFTSHKCSKRGKCSSVHDFPTVKDISYDSLNNNLSSAENVVRKITPPHAVIKK